MTNFFFFGDMTSALNGMISQLVASVPGIIGAIVVFIVGFIIAKLLSKFITKFLEKIQIDKLGDKLQEIEIVDKSNLKFKISAILGKIVYYFLLIFFAVFAADILGMPAISQIVLDIFNFIPKLIMALVILVIGLLASDAISKVIYTTCNSLGIPSAKLLSTFVFYFLFINIFILALTQANINTEFLSQNISILIGGVVLAFSIGYGFASKDIVSNLLASFYSKDKFQLGDTITFEGEKGKITNIDRSTLTIQADDKKIIFPLSKLTNQKVEIHNS